MRRYRKLHETLARISHQGGNNEGQQAQKDENGSEMEESVPWRGEN